MLTFHADAAPELHEPHEVPENDSPQGEGSEDGETADDGSNVVSVDFTRKK
jgi:hypothetical protein